MKELKECLVCGGGITPFFNMGKQPLVNNLKSSPQEEDSIFPLLVNECQSCSHKQLSISVDRELMFSNYLYQTGHSKSHREFFMRFVDEIENKLGYWSASALDIGCNDGSLLEEFEYRNWDVLGIEPCKEFNQNVPVIRDFFPTKIDKKFDVITAFNVFAHNDDPYTFLMEMAKLLKEDGRIYILTTPARLDNFYHEHISYFTPQSMMVLAQRCGVEVVSFKTVSMHGESYLFEIRNKPIVYKNKGFYENKKQILDGVKCSLWGKRK